MLLHVYTMGALVVVDDPWWFCLELQTSLTLEADMVSLLPRDSSLLSIAPASEQKGALVWSSIQPLSEAPDKKFSSATSDKFYPRIRRRVRDAATGSVSAQYRCSFLELQTTFDCSSRQLLSGALDKNFSSGAPHKICPRGKRHGRSASLGAESA